MAHLGDDSREESSIRLAMQNPGSLTPANVSWNVEELVDDLQGRVRWL